MQPLPSEIPTMSPPSRLRRENQRASLSQSWKTFRKELVSYEADYLCVIARKMPRLAEILEIESNGKTLISDRALPWLTLQPNISSQRILLADDTLNIGTTIRYAIDQCCRLGIRQEHIAVRVWGQRLGTNATASGITDNYDFLAVRTFSEEEYQQSQHSIPKMLKGLLKPYDLDFPILYSQLDEDFTTLSEPERYSALKTRFGQVVSLTTALQRAYGLESYSVIDPIISTQCTLSKMRIMIGVESGVCVLTPICVQPVPTSVLESGDFNFVHPQLLELYERYSNLPAPITLYKFEPQYYLYLYLQSLDYFLATYRVQSHRFDFLSASSLHFNSIDLQLSFGPIVGQAIVDDLASLLSLLEQHTPSGAQVESSAPSDLAIEADSYLAEQRITMQLDLLAKECRDKTLEAGPAALGDSHKHLRDGFTAETLFDLLEDVDSNLNRTQFSALLDFMIEKGIIVPVVNEQESIYQRVYRRGEYKEAELRDTVYRLLKDYQNHSESPYLSAIVLEKVLCAIAIFLPDMFPLHLVFGSFGGTARIGIDQSDGGRRFVRLINEMESLTMVQVDEPKKSRGPDSGNLFADS
jgi:hypothetical protein